jgi:hypothetical protein
MPIHINASDVCVFNVDDFPELKTELAGIKARMRNLLCTDTAGMVASFARYHRIQASLVRANPALSTMISSRNAFQQLESIYGAYGDRSDFALSLDQYLVRYFNQ